MEIALVIIVPFILLMAGASLLVVAQVSNFVQSGYMNRRQIASNSLLQQYMAQIVLAQSQVYRRTRELEALSSQLALSNQELAGLNAMKSKFLSMVVHDVRTPLASIRGFSGLLLQRDVGEKEEEYLRHIVAATDQLGRLIADLTDLAMIEAGKLRMELSTFEYGDIARDILPGLSISAQKKGVELVFGEPPSPCPVRGDKFRLSQVLMNLVNNAIKFTPPGRRVELSMRREGRFLSAYVKDAGIGIHPSETRRIFEKFYQAKHQKDEKLRRQGWGLGLSIAQEIVRAHKGEIGASSPGLGKGSTFWFKVPSGL